MVQNAQPDPFEALVAQGVTAKAPDPSAEPTVVGPLEAAESAEEEVVWLSRPEDAPDQEVVAAAGVVEPEPVLPPPWWRQRTAQLAAAGVAVVLLGVIVAVAVTSSSPAPEVPPPAQVASPRPVVAPRAPPAAVPEAPAPAPAPKAKRPSRPVQRSGDFAEWPGDRRSNKPPPPKDGEGLKRPAF